MTFSRISSDGEEGYPGNLTIQATYGLNDDNEIHLNVTATTDKATIINITNHSYFNLAGQVILKSSNAFSIVTLFAHLYNHCLKTKQCFLVCLVPVYGNTENQQFKQNLFLVSD